MAEEQRLLTRTPTEPRNSSRRNSSQSVSRALVSALDEATLFVRGETPKWELACAPFDFAAVQPKGHGNNGSSGGSHHHAHHPGASGRSGSQQLALSPIRPLAASGHHHQQQRSSTTPVRANISWSELRGTDVPRVRIPVNFYQGVRIRPLVLVMDGGAHDPLPIYEKLRATFELDQLFLDGMSADFTLASTSAAALSSASSADVATATATPKSAHHPADSSASGGGPTAINTVERVAWLLQHGRQHDVVLSVPKLTYRGELVHRRTQNFFEQADDIRREFVSQSPTTGPAATSTRGSPGASLAAAAAGGSGQHMWMLLSSGAGYDLSGALLPTIASPHQLPGSGMGCGVPGVSSVLPDTPDHQLMFRIGSATELKHGGVFTPSSAASMSAGKVNATPFSFCFQQQPPQQQGGTGRAPSTDGGRALSASLLTPTHQGEV